MTNKEQLQQFIDLRLKKDYNSNKGVFYIKTSYDIHSCPVTKCFDTREEANVYYDKISNVLTQIFLRTQRFNNRIYKFYEKSL